MKYEIVVRRRQGLGTAIAAVGEMLWSEEDKMFAFTWIVAEDSEVNPVILVEVDLYEGETLIGHGDYLRFVYRGEGYRFVYHGPPMDDGEADDSDDPKPPGITIDFDPNELLKDVILVPA